MDLSLFLAKVLGLYLLVVCGAVLVHWKRLPAFAKTWAEDDGLIVFSGAVALLLGLLLVVGHNVWEMSWRGVITLLGWLTILRGVLRLFFPDAVKRLVKSVRGPWYQVVLFVFLFVGMWLTYTGFTLS